MMNTSKARMRRYNPEELRREESVPLSLKIILSKWWMAGRENLKLKN
jgi:hypothetical protein